MTGDRHVRFCESGRGRFPPATHREASHLDSDSGGRHIAPARIIVEGQSLKTVFMLVNSRMPIADSSRP
jgi:hypothetical protein